MWLPLKGRAGFSSDGGFQTLVGSVEGEVREQPFDQFNLRASMRLVTRDGKRHHVVFTAKVLPDIRRGERISVYGMLDRQGIFHAVKISDAETGAVLANAGGCFVATAACGRPDAPEVMRLRAFRDHVLAHRNWGRRLTRLYYRLSPTPAAWLTRHAWARPIVRGMLIQPAAFVASKCFNRKDCRTDG